MTDRFFEKPIYWGAERQQPGTYGRWAFAELTDMYHIETSFAARIEAELGKIIDQLAAVVV